MTRNALFAFPLLLLLSSLSLSAQQPSPPQAPPDPPRPPHRKAHDVQYRTFSPGDMGMRPELRIAPSGIWWKNPEIVQKLTLTSDQQKRMDDIFQQSRLQLIDLKANVEKQEVMLEPMLSANPPDTNKVLSQIDHVASARAELEKANARMLLGIRGVLSADQWTKLQAEQRENQRFMFHFKGGPGGPNPPGFGPGFKMSPDGPTSLKVFPKGPVSQLILPSPQFDFAAPEQNPLFEFQFLAPDDDLDM